MAARLPLRRPEPPRHPVLCRGHRDRPGPLATAAHHARPGRRRRPGRAHRRRTRRADHRREAGHDPWHPHHITERYRLFTLILLGESLLASANAIIEALHDDHALGSLFSISALALVVTAAMWWIYFWPPHHEAISSFANSLRYGYVHYFVFAAVGALSAGIEVEIDVLTDQSKLGDVAASFTVTVPIAVFVLGIWWIALRQNADRVVNVVVPLGAVLVLLDSINPIPVTVTAVIMVVVVIVLVVRPPVRRSRSGHSEHSEHSEHSDPAVP